MAKAKAKKSSSKEEPKRLHLVKYIDRSARTASAINYKGKYHDPKEGIKYSFTGGTAAQKQYVRDGFQLVIDAAPGLIGYFTEVASGGDVRIGFDKNVSWSYIGTDIYLVSSSQNTMNIGWMDEYKTNVVHEILHTLNFAHEHVLGVNYDWPKVYGFYAEYGFSKADVDRNFRVDESTVDHDGHHDNDSIMKYYIPCYLTTDGKNCGQNNKVMSSKDIEKLNEMFPASNAPVTEEPETEEPTAPTGTSAFEQRAKYVNLVFQEDVHMMTRLNEDVLIRAAAGLGIYADASDLKKVTAGKILKVAKDAS